MDEDKQIKRVNFEDYDEDEDTGEEFLCEKEQKDEDDLEKSEQQPNAQTSKVEDNEVEDEELNEMDKICNLASFLSKSVAFDEEDVAMLTLKKAQLLKNEQKTRTLTKAVAKAHFQSTIEERENVLSNAVKRGLLDPGSETFLFFVKKQAKLVDLAQKLY